MLTVKHVTIHGNEAIYEARNVQFCPVEGADLSKPWGTSSEPLGVLYMRHNSDALEEISDGVAYVMNDHGSTVAKYDLGRWGTQAGPQTFGRAAATLG